VETTVNTPLLQFTLREISAQRSPRHMIRLSTASEGHRTCGFCNAGVCNAGVNYHPSLEPDQQSPAGLCTSPPKPTVMPFTAMRYGDSSPIMTGEPALAGGYSFRYLPNASLAVDCSWANRAASSRNCVQC